MNTRLMEAFWLTVAFFLAIFSVTWMLTGDTLASLIAAGGLFLASALLSS